MNAVKAGKKQSEGIRCAHLCSGGNKCLCYGDIPHSFHICKDPACQCHSLPRVQPKQVAMMKIGKVSNG